MFEEKFKKTCDEFNGKFEGNVCTFRLPNAIVRTELREKDNVPLIQMDSVTPLTEQAKGEVTNFYSKFLEKVLEKQ